MKAFNFKYLNNLFKNIFTELKYLKGALIPKIHKNLLYQVDLASRLQQKKKKATKKKQQLYSSDM